MTTATMDRGGNERRKPQPGPSADKGIPPNTRELAEYTEGQASFARGECEDHNPYESGGNRISWFTGYYDARTNANLAGVFARNNITFP